MAGNPEAARKGKAGEAQEPEMQPREYDEASDAAEERTELTTEYCEPVTATEKKMVVLWQEFFGIRQIGTRDNFFELGGDSLKAMTLSKRVFREFNVNLPLEKYFINPAILFIAKEIDTVLGMQLVYQKSSDDRKAKKIVI
jgi:acyl carrier protein